MRYTNLQQIMHADVTFILNDEIPHICINYINDVLIKDSTMRYEIIKELYKIILENFKIRQFI